MNAPGSLFYRLAAPMLSESGRVRVLDPWLADLRFELATTTHGSRRACIRLVYTFALWRSLLRPSLWSKGVSRTLNLQLGGVAVTTIVLATVPFWDPMSRVAPSRRLVLVLLLIPQALAVALPLGSLLGVIVAIGRNATSAARMTALSVAVLCSITTAAVLQWGSPVANQAFRVTYAQRTLARGFGEMSLTELAAAATHGSDERRNLARREFQPRLTLISAPIALTLFLVSLASSVRFPRAAGLATLVGYSVYFNYERAMLRPGDGSLWVFAVAWLPTIVLFTAAVAAIQSQRVNARS